jgi:hypothetical protein
MREPIARGGQRGRGLAVAAWLIVASAGTLVVWRLSAYVESLTALARSDRAAAAGLFRSRVLPAVGVIALISVLAGALLARQGVVALRSGRLPQDDGAGVDEADPGQRGARILGLLFISAGAGMALLPLALFVVMAWALR